LKAKNLQRKNLTCKERKLINNQFKKKNEFVFKIKKCKPGGFQYPQGLLKGNESKNGTHF
jgi:hypothetical protein